ncbi:anti-sigma factor [Pseudanabaena biceps]|nr:anti-sigma factor [Pseudanabaena biceps]
MNQKKLNDLLGLTDLEAIALDDIQCDDIQCGEELVDHASEIELKIENELKALRNATATIAYAEPILAVPASLKQRLFNRIQQETKVLDLVAKRSGKLKWKPHPVKGLVMTILNIDLFKRQVSALVRAEVTVAYPSHRHAKGEEIFMLEGELMDGAITYKAGDYLYSKAGSVHAPLAIAGCMFFVKTSLEDNFL